MRFRSYVLLIGAVTSLSFVAHPASAAPRTTRGGRSLRWQRPEITLSLATNELPAGISIDQALEALRHAAATWSSPKVACTAMSIRVTVLQGASTVENDGVNVVAFRKREWCRDGVKRRGSCYSAHTAALTTIHHGQVISGSSDRAIDDADIELNAHDFSWGVGPATASTATPTLDLREVLRHEFGHVLGFNHVCEPGDRARRGGVAACEELSGERRQSIMLPGADSADGSVLGDRKLTTDDVAALCAAYPAKQSMQGAFGCAVVRLGATSSPYAWLSIAIAATLRALIRNRRRERSTVRRV